MVHLYKQILNMELIAMGSVSVIYVAEHTAHYYVLRTTTSTDGKVYSIKKSSECCRGIFTDNVVRSY